MDSEYIISDDKDDKHQATEQGQPSDTKMLDWLQKQTRGYGIGWVCRDSSCGHGLRVHETSRDDAHTTVREAIATAMRDGI